MKADIATNVVRNTMRNKKKALTEQEQALALECWEELVPVPLRHKLQQVPSAYLHMNSGIAVSFAGNFRVLYFDKPMPVANTCGVALNIEKDSRIHKKYLAYSEAQEARDKQQKELRREINALISPCKTTKQLLEAWPNVAECLSEDLNKRLFGEEEKHAPVPAVRYEVVDELIRSLKGE